MRVRLAFERVKACVDREMLKLSNAECHKLAAMVEEMARGMVPHQDAA